MNWNNLNQHSYYDNNDDGGVGALNATITTNPLQTTDCRQPFIAVQAIKRPKFGRNQLNLYGRYEVFCASSIIQSITSAIGKGDVKADTVCQIKSELIQLTVNCRIIKKIISWLTHNRTSLLASVNLKLVVCQTAVSRCSFPIHPCLGMKS